MHKANDIHAITEEIIYRHIVIKEAATEIKSLQLRKIAAGQIKTIVEHFTKVATKAHHDELTHRASAALTSAASLAEDLVDKITQNYDNMGKALSRLERYKVRKTTILKEMSVMLAHLTVASLNALIRKSSTPIENLNDDYKTFDLMVRTPEHIIKEFNSASRNEITISRLKYTLQIQEGNIANWETRLGILNHTTHFSRQIQMLKENLSEVRHALDSHTDLKNTLDDILDYMVRFSLILTEERIYEEEETHTTKAEPHQTKGER